MLAVLAAASTADSSCAACSGTCNLVTGECSCPITHSGPNCQQPLLPACTAFAATLRPMFWLHRVTREAWRRQKQPLTPSAIGALPCECIQQMLRLLAPYRSKWADLPSQFLCSAASLAQLLQAPGQVEWLNMTAAFNHAARTYTFTTRATERAPAVEAFSAQLQVCRARALTWHSSPSHDTASTSCRSYPYP